MNLVVVSNRVARGKPNEPMTGGLAAALLPVVEKSGAIWVGSSGRVRDGNQKEPFAEIEALGRRRAGDARSAGGALRRLLRRLCQFGAVAGAAFARRSDPRLAGRLSSAIAKSTPSWRARCCASGSRTPRSGFRTIISSRSARSCAISASRSRSASSCIRRGRRARVISGVPHHRELIEAMLAYDLIGFQTEEDCENFLSYAQSELGLVVHDGVVISRHGRTRAAVFPIGIDPQKFAQQAAKAVDASGRLAAAPQPERREARDRRRPAGLFQGPGQPHQGLRPDVDLAAAACAHRVAAADRNAVARRDRGLWQSAERGRKTRQRRQRRAMARSTGRRSAISTRAMARPCSRASIAPRRSAW